MRYASIRSLDTSNGEGVGVSLFVQGCRFHCKGCFNSDTWDFNGGKEWDDDVKEKFLNLIDRPYITRVSILGGEPLDAKNRYEIFLLVQDIRKRFGYSKKIWIYSGSTFEEILNCREQLKAIIEADVLVDGRYEEDKKDLKLQWRGSFNQRIIDIHESIKHGCAIRWGQ